MLKKRNAGRCYQACPLYFPIQALKSISEDFL